MAIITITETSRLVFVQTIAIYGHLWTKSASKENREKSSFLSFLFCARLFDWCSISYTIKSAGKFRNNQSFLIDAFLLGFDHFLFSSQIILSLCLLFDPVSLANSCDLWRWVSQAKAFGNVSKMESFETENLTDVSRIRSTGSHIGNVSLTGTLVMKNFDIKNSSRLNFKMADRFWSELRFFH